MSTKLDSIAQHLSIFTKPPPIRSTLGLGAAFLCANVLSSHALGRGVLQIHEDAGTPLGQVVIIFIGTFLLTTLLLPLIGTVVAGLLGAATSQWVCEKTSAPPPDWVSLRDARRHALLRRDTLWIDRTDKALAAEQHAFANAVAFERQAFTILTFLALDLESPQSVTVQVASAVGLTSRPGLAAILCSLVLLWCWRATQWTAEDATIYHPELFAELQTQKVARHRNQQVRE